MTAQCHAAVNTPRKEGEMDIATELAGMEKMTAGGAHLEPAGPAG